MNRHARRRAAALARRQTGYLHRVLAAVHNGAMPTAAGLHIASIEHDPGCSIYRGADCDCVPEISVSSPDAIAIIDEDGQGRKVATQ